MCCFKHNKKSRLPKKAVNEIFPNMKDIKIRKKIYFAFVAITLLIIISACGREKPEKNQ